MTTAKMDPQSMNERFALSPYGRWLGMRVDRADENGVECTIPWRDDFIGTPGTQIAHGGVLAAVVDSAGSYAVAARHGRPLPTIDLRIDYHRPIVGEDMTVTARIIRLGGRLATAEVAIFNAEAKLAVSGRGLYAVS